MLRAATTWTGFNARQVGQGHVHLKGDFFPGHSRPLKQRNGIIPNSPHGPSTPVLKPRGLYKTRGDSNRRYIFYKS